MPWPFRSAFQNQSEALDAAKKWPEALALSKERLQVAPDDPHAHWMAAKSYFHLRDFDNAVTSWEKAVALNPEWKDMARSWLEAARGGQRVQKHPLPVPRVTESAEARERRALEARARLLLGQKNYRQIETLAGQLRTTQATFPDGTWKLDSFHTGLCQLPERQRSSARAWQALHRQLQAWVKGNAASVTAQTALAQALLYGAWAARGHDYADTVTGSGWRTVEAQTTQARQVLDQAKNLRRRCPLWYRTAQRLAVLQGWPMAQYDALFDEARQVFPNYSGFYFSKAVYILPRWYGKAGDWEKFAEQMARQKGGANGDILYARIVWYLQSTAAGVLKESRFSWPRTQKGYGALLKRYPQSLEVASQFCFLAGVVREFALMQKLHEQHIKGRVDLGVWETQKLFVQRRQWAFGAT